MHPAVNRTTKVTHRFDPCPWSKVDLWGMGLLGVSTCFARRTQIGSNPISSTKIYGGVAQLGEHRELAIRINKCDKGGLYEQR